MENSQPILSPQISKNLNDKLYEKRKLAALEIEKQVRDYVAQGNPAKITQLISVLVKEFSYSTNPNSRNGGLIGLAATAIALGSNVGTYLESIVKPILSAFNDLDGRVRYYACESMYNVGKVARGLILTWFNEIFDALTKLSVDVELSVKNGAELLDRLIKDIVTEKSTYFSSADVETDTNTQQTGADEELPTEDLAEEKVPGSVKIVGNQGPTTFNLPRFIPLLKERIGTTNPASRLFLVQWIYVLHSIPDLDLLAYLKEFLDGLFQYLSDANVDVRTATLNVLGDFLKEIADAVGIKHRPVDSLEGLEGENNFLEQNNDLAFNQFRDGSSVSSIEPDTLRRLNIQNEDNIQKIHTLSRPINLNDSISIDWSSMTTILVKYLSSPDEETQATALRWINMFIVLARNEMLPFTALLLDAILPTLSHQVTAIRSLAIDANTNLFTLVFDWSIQTTDPRRLKSIPQPRLDQFDIVTTVVALMRLCQDEHEDTRVGSLEWLLMLHKKYPKQVMNSDQLFFQGLLKTLSDYSEEVVRRDLQLLAQISHSSDDEYWTKFMVNLLNLFTIDRRLLETRGSLIIRQLCKSLNPERMYRSFGEILEQEQDLEFATTMVQTLNLILITAPELVDMRSRLKSIDSREGSSLFCALYRSWCHNPIAVFSLCLLAGAYEHASNLILTFGEIEMTVQILVQADKLVQLLESPVFTGLRLQLLEPEKYPYLYKCLYGILMLLPQSSAFATLRNRLNSVSSLSVLYPVQLSPPPSVKTSKKEQQPTVNFKWSEFLAHYKIVQKRHERARRAMANASRTIDGLIDTKKEERPASPPLLRYSKTTDGRIFKK